MNDVLIMHLVDLLAPVNPTGATTHQENDFGALLEPKLRQVFYNSYNELPEQFSKIYHVKTSKKAKETDYGLGAMTPWSKFGASQTTVADATAMPTVQYQKINAGLERTYVHEEFASGFMVERKFVDDEQYDTIMKMPKDLARAGRYKVEQDAASLFNNALVVTPTATIYDGKPLFAIDHPLAQLKNAQGVAITTKGNNLIVGTLSDVTLQNALLLGRKQVDEAGKLIVMNFDTLVVPPALEYKARILLQSSGITGSANNDINVLKGKLNIVVWDFLNKDDACFLMDSSAHQANFFWRVKVEFNREKDFDSFVSKYNGYMRYSYGVSDWRGLIAIKPTT
ncbi:MAG: Mu-like prophage major head subunit gpT family protein [Clostridium sp.]